MTAHKLRSRWRVDWINQFALRIVDLNEITVIDKSGEEVLSMMICDGATFVATGLYTRHLLKALRERTAKSPMQD
jgi:hypothetical protein